MSPTILIIDDEKRIRILLRIMLEKEGYNILEAENGEEGIRLFHSHTPDLIISDIIMPEKEGVETICELRRSNPEVKIIAISGGGRHLAEDYLPLAKELGAVKIMRKPIFREDLIQTVTEVLSP
ncbi:MAG: response regulator [Desulfococcaceae bacterium]|jgi:CheY-like chemotaxis protein|nr:response regulator [Desulfococcaceae bacterium]